MFKVIYLKIIRNNWIEGLKRCFIFAGRVVVPRVTTFLLPTPISIAQQGIIYIILRSRDALI